VRGKQEQRGTRGRSRQSAKARQVRVHITEDVEGHRKHDRQGAADAELVVQRRVLFKFLDSDCTGVLAPNVPR
jgi:hypothetical protein